MKRDQIIAELLRAKPYFEEQGVIHLEIFGSQARGDAHPNSDLDLLLDVAAQSNFSLFELVDIEKLVEEKIGFQTNAYLKRSLNTSFKTSIEPDLVEVF